MKIWTVHKVELQWVKDKKDRNQFTILSCILEPPRGIC